MTSLHRLGGLRLENSLDQLLSVKGLSAITRLEDHLFVGEVPVLESFAGLDNIEFIGGNVEIPIRSEDDLKYFVNLETVGGNVEIGGELTIRGRIYDSSVCE